ncbi:MAG: YceI family protein [Caulobacteraceae bacterium]
MRSICFWSAAPAILLGVMGLAPAAMARPCPPGLPPGVYCGAPDAALAPAGTYALDPAHAAVIARVPHIGYSWSVFRFDEVEGTLAWVPGHPSASKLSASVDTASIATNVPGFAKQLAGEEMLRSATFPRATYVSTSFRRIDPTHASVDGQFTLMGKTRPLTFAVDLVGAGKGFAGHPRLGVHATAAISPADYGLPAMFDRPIDLVVDAEFEQKAR